MVGDQQGVLNTFPCETHLAVIGLPFSESAVHAGHAIPARGRAPDVLVPAALLFALVPGSPLSIFIINENAVTNPQIASLCAMVIRDWY
jgi:hypothetical protein